MFINPQSYKYSICYNSLGFTYVILITLAPKNSKLKIKKRKRKTENRKQKTEGVPWRSSGLEHPSLVKEVRGSSPALAINFLISNISRELLCYTANQENSPINTRRNSFSTRFHTRERPAQARAEQLFQTERSTPMRNGK